MTERFATKVDTHWACLRSDGKLKGKRLVLFLKSLRNNPFERFSCRARLGKRGPWIAFTRFPSRLLGLLTDVGKRDWL